MGVSKAPQNPVSGSLTIFSNSINSGFTREQNGSGGGVCYGEETNILKVAGGVSVIVEVVLAVSNSNPLTPNSKLGRIDRN